MSGNTTKNSAAPFVEHSSFRRAPPKLKNMYYKDAKEKDQMIFFTYGLFLSHGG